MEYEVLAVLGWPTTRRQWTRWMVKRESWLHFLFLLLLLSAYGHEVSSSEDLTTLLVCEGDVANLACPSGKHIRIHLANFGRFSIQPCNPTMNLEINTQCQNDNTMPLLRQRCDLQNACNFTADVNLFGDTCPGSAKYLETQYCCVDNGATTTSLPAFTSSHSSEDLKAEYGKASMTEAPIERPNSSCPVHFVRYLVWPKTNSNHLAKLPCPASTLGSAEWMCSAAGEWFPTSGPDLSGCVSDWSKELRNDATHNGDTPEMMEEILRELYNSVHREQLFGGDLINSIGTLSEVVRNHSFAFNANLARRARGMSRLVLGLADILSSNEPVWLDLPPYERRRQADILLQGIGATTRLLAHSLPAANTTSLLVEGEVSETGKVASELSIVPSSQLQHSMMDLVLPALIAGTQGRVKQTSSVHLPSSSIASMAEVGAVAESVIALGRISMNVSIAGYLDAHGKELAPEGGKYQVEPTSSSVTHYRPRYGFISIEVLSLAIATLEGDLRGEWRHASDPLTAAIYFRITPAKEGSPTHGVSRPKCIWWNEDKAAWMYGRRGSARGCWLKEHNTTHALCECILPVTCAVAIGGPVDSGGLSVDYWVLTDVAVYVGCAVALISFLSVLNRMVLGQGGKKLTSNNSSFSAGYVTTSRSCSSGDPVLLNLALCLLATELLILLAHMGSVQLLCTWLAISVYHLFLASFSWTLLGVSRLYLHSISTLSGAGSDRAVVFIAQLLADKKNTVSTKKKSEGDHRSGEIYRIYGFGYGLPATLMALAFLWWWTVLDSHCMLITLPSPTLAACLVPTSLVVICTMVLLALLLAVLCSHSAMHQDYNKPSACRSDHSAVQALRSEFKKWLFFVFILTACYTLYVVSTVEALDGGGSAASNWVAISFSLVNAALGFGCCYLIRPTAGSSQLMAMDKGKWVPKSLLHSAMMLDKGGKGEFSDTAESPRRQNGFLNSQRGQRGNDRAPQHQSTISTSATSAASSESSGSPVMTAVVNHHHLPATKPVNGYCANKQQPLYCPHPLHDAGSGLGRDCPTPYRYYPNHLEDEMLLPGQRFRLMHQSGFNGAAEVENGFGSGCYDYATIPSEYYAAGEVHSSQPGCASPHYSSHPAPYHRYQRRLMERRSAGRPVPVEIPQVPHPHGPPSSILLPRCPQSSYESANTTLIRPGGFYSPAFTRVAYADHKLHVHIDPVGSHQPGAVKMPGRVYGVYRAAPPELPPPPPPPANMTLPPISGFPPEIGIESGEVGSSQQLSMVPGIDIGVSTRYAVQRAPSVSSNAPSAASATLVHRMDLRRNPPVYSELQES